MSTTTISLISSVFCCFHAHLYKCFVLHPRLPHFDFLEGALEILPAGHGGCSYGYTDKMLAPSAHTYTASQAIPLTTNRKEKLTGSQDYKVQMMLKST